MAAEWKQRPGGPLADAFPISGSIDPKTFPFLLMDLHRHGATGSLKVEGPSYQKALYFRSGRILFGSSNDPRDQLGAILIQTGKITPEQLEDVTAKVGPGNPLAKALADTGYVSQRELSDAARAKVESILSDVIAYTAGNFEFEDGVLPKGAIDLKLPTERLVLSSVRRLSDRNFVLRHLDGLEVVLIPGPDLVPKLADLQPDGGGLPEQLDGSRTLKEAAALTKLDEFEAAKVACALLFLGLVQRAPAEPPGIVAEEAPVKLAEDPLFTMSGGDGPELDLGDTARMSIEVPAEPPPAPSPVPSATPPPASPPSAPSVPIAMMAAAAPEPPQPEPEPEPFFIPDVAPTVIMPPPAEPMMEPEPEPEPKEDTKPLPVTPATVMMPAAEPFGFENDTEEAVPQPAPRAQRPSAEDQAAVDALLNAPAVRPAAAMPERRPARTETRIPPPSPRPAVRRGGGRAPSTLIYGGVALLLVAVAIGGAWYVWGRGTTRPAAKQAAASPTATMPAATVTPPPTGSTVTSTGTPAPVLPSPRLPVRPSPASQARTTPANLAEARTLLQSGNLDAAAQGFAATVKAAPASSASVQILVACSPETVQKAVQNAGSPELFIVPVHYKGRDCYRLCWGLYESASRAASAVPSLPEYFRKGATPRVIAASEIVR